MKKPNPDPRNARRHPQRNKDLIKQSLEEVGAFRSIAIDGDDVIRAGNGVYEQAQALGMKLRIVETAADELIGVKRADLRGEKAIRAALWDNRTGETSEWDDEVLTQLRDDCPDILKGILESKDPLPPSVEVPVTDHIVVPLCFSSSDADSVAACFNEAQSMRDNTNVLLIAYRGEWDKVTKKLAKVDDSLRLCYVGHQITRLVDFWIKHHDEYPEEVW